MDHAHHRNVLPAAVYRSDLYHFFLDAGIGDAELILRPVALAEPEPVESILKFRATVEAMMKADQLMRRKHDCGFRPEERRTSGRFCWCDDVHCFRATSVPGGKIIATWNLIATILQVA
jgi:hypothetical protein